MNHTGRHVILDGITSVSSFVTGGKLEELLKVAAVKGGATPLHCKVIELPIEGVSRPSSPPGGTAWLALDESAITLHWYVDGDKVQFALDVFTCGTIADPLTISDYFANAIKVESTMRVKTLERF